tara:strand:+ start:27 stop:170 length:144 start_codon:yes stop_codon:yes gene_type:complete
MENIERFYEVPNASRMNQRQINQSISQQRDIEDECDYLDSMDEDRTM